MKNRKHFISLNQAETLEDAAFLAPDWTIEILAVESGWMCYEQPHGADVWEGRS